MWIIRGLRYLSSQADAGLAQRFESYLADVCARQDMDISVKSQRLRKLPGQRKIVLTVVLPC